MHQPHPGLKNIPEVCWKRRRTNNHQLPEERLLLTILVKSLFPSTWMILDLDLYRTGQWHCLVAADHLKGSGFTQATDLLR